ncbi:hypothetical protein [Nitrosomonas sp. Nm33]|uniref:hypothetical protein n=1 Tax=Nitrosomonas sp. Nm33 TaxID=133724 RepID=UPI00115FE1D9|nr:hypothetical protein [Nitrosomonas sp. Nm33]
MSESYGTYFPGVPRGCHQKARNISGVQGCAIEKRAVTAVHRSSQFWHYEGWCRRSCETPASVDWDIPITCE